MHRWISKKEESQEENLEKIKDNSKKFIEYIEKESIGINYDCLKIILIF